MVKGFENVSGLNVTNAALIFRRFWSNLTLFHFSFPRPRCSSVYAISDRNAAVIGELYKNRKYQKFEQNGSVCASLWSENGRDGTMVGTWGLLVVLVAGCACRKPYSYQFVRRDYQYFSRDEADQWMCMIFGLCVIDPSYGQKPELGLVYQWKQLEFDYANARDRQNAIDREEFIPGKPAPIDMDVHYNRVPNKKNRVFTTIPRFQPGVPVTFGVVTDRKLNDNPIITPYPSWSWHTDPQLCKRDRLVSVFRVMIDECQRLWILDTGRLLNNQTCPPQIIAFDLKTNTLIHRFEIPSELLESRSILVTPVVDVRDPHSECRDTFVYVADCQTYSIIVHDVQKSIAWKATDKTMYPYPNYGTYTILGNSFDLMDGVLGMALSPYQPGEDRILFYHAMSSPTENWVYTSDLRNRTRFEDNPESSPEVFHTYIGERRTQSAAEAIDKDGIMYFGLMKDVTFNCWNTHTNYGPKTTEIIARNRQTLQFASGVKVVTNNRGKQEVWVLTSRFQRVATDTLSTTDFNFRIQAGRTEDLVFGTVCKPQGGGGGGYGYLRSGSSN